MRPREYWQLADEVGKNDWLLLRQSDCSSLSGIKAGEQPRHVPTKIPHILHSFLVLAHFVWICAVYRIPVTGRDDGICMREKYLCI